MSALSDLEATIDAAITDETTVGSITPTIVGTQLKNVAIFAASNPGATGATGATGEGVPAGGTVGQVLAKIDSTDFNTQWETPSGGGPSTTDGLTEGETNLYFTVARVIAAVLTGISFGSISAVTAADSILVAIGKLQAQISELWPQALTGTALDFSKSGIYGNVTAETGNFTYSSSGALPGNTIIVVHNNGTAPTFAENMVALTGSGTYVISVNNYITFTYINATKVIYAINQEA